MSEDELGERPIISVLGMGVRGRRQLTLEAFAILTRTRHALFFPQAGIDTAWLEQELGIPKTTDLSVEYRDGARDRDNYQRILDRVAGAARNDGAVCFLLPGHPRLGVTMTSLLDSDPTFAGMTVRVIEGVSSFDTMLCDLHRDALEHSSLLIDANRLLYYGLTLDARIDMYVYHICSVGTQRTHWREPRRENQICRLQAYLERYYPAQHQVTLIESSVSRPAGARTTVISLDALGAAIDAVTFRTTLFVPALAEVTTTYDHEFASLLGGG